MRSRLAIFDVDGTLTQTNSVDDECYCRAAADALGVTAAEIAWTDSPHITDSGIADWLWTVHRGRSPTGAEIAELRQRFVELLERERTESPHRFQPVEGARDAMARLQSSGWSIAIATGAWGASAAIKLNAIGFTCADLTFACADDAPSRYEIVQLARSRAEARTGSVFDRVVSVGDARWDVRTARELGLPFVGVGRGGRAERLRAAGATMILPDLSDWRLVLEHLEHAAVPS